MSSNLHHLLQFSLASFMFKSQKYGFEALCTVHALFLLDTSLAPMNPQFKFHSLSHIVLSWTSPTDSPCITNYTIFLTNITEGDVVYIYNTTTNATSIVVSDLTQGAVYSFTVAGVDAGDRIGEKSVPSDVVTVDGENMKANSFKNMLCYSRNFDTLIMALYVYMCTCVCSCICALGCSYHEY